MKNNKVNAIDIILLVFGIIAFVMITLSIIVQTQPFLVIGTCIMAPLVIINSVRLAKRTKKGE